GGSAPPTVKRCDMTSSPCSPPCAARRCRGCGSTEVNVILKVSHEPDSARKRQVAHLHGCDGGAPAARAWRQAQSSRGGGVHHRFHRRRCARRQDRGRIDGGGAARDRTRRGGVWAIRNRS